MGHGTFLLVCAGSGHQDDRSLLPTGKFHLPGLWRHEFDDERRTPPPPHAEATTTARLGTALGARGPCLCVVDNASTDETAAHFARWDGP
jgi:hypothetical protein